MCQLIQLVPSCCEHWPNTTLEPFPPPLNEQKGRDNVQKQSKHCPYSYRLLVKRNGETHIAGYEHPLVVDYTIKGDEKRDLLINRLLSPQMARRDHGMPIAPLEGS